MPLIAMLVVYGLPFAAIAGCMVIESRNIGMAVPVIVVFVELVGLGWFVRRVARLRRSLDEARFYLNFSLEPALLLLCVGWLVSVFWLWLADGPPEPGQDIAAQAVNPIFFYGLVMVIGWIWVVLALIEPVGRDE